MSPFYAGVGVGSILGFFAFPWVFYAMHGIESAISTRRVRPRLTIPYGVSKAPEAALTKVVGGWRTAPVQSPGKAASKDRAIAQRSG